ncbi:MAG: kelch repeat-containing protein [Mycobacterium sp.]
MPTARSGLAAVATPGGLIYALGGFDGQGNILATVEIYDPSTNNWRTSKPMPTPRANLAAVFFGPDQNIYAIGGRNNNGVLDTVEIFNPQFGWQQSVPLSEPISALAAVAGPKTPRIYAIGGFDRNLTPLASIFSYDPNEVDNGWVELFPMPTARGFLAAVTGSDGLIYAIGGVDQMGQNNVIDNVVGSVEAFTFG